MELFFAQDLFTQDRIVHRTGDILDTEDGLPGFHVLVAPFGEPGHVQGTTEAVLTHDVDVTAQGVDFGTEVLQAFAAPVEHLPTRNLLPCPVQCPHGVTTDVPHLLPGPDATFTSTRERTP